MRACRIKESAHLQTALPLFALSMMAISRKNEFLKILREGSAYERFEALEHFTALISNEADVLHLITILHNDDDPIVRHEAAAQLLRAETIKPDATGDMRAIICAALVKALEKDSSIIVQHEALEALAYIGDAETLRVLDSFRNSPNPDIRSAANVAFDMLCFRISKSVRASDLGKAIGMDIVQV